jgi:hypothetical protein
VLQVGVLHVRLIGRQLRGNLPEWTPTHVSASEQALSGYLLGAIVAQGWQDGGWFNLAAGEAIPL